MRRRRLGLLVACAMSFGLGMLLALVPVAGGKPLSSPYDGNYVFSFTVTTSEAALARPGQRLVGLEASVVNGRISGDLSGVVASNGRSLAVSTLSDLGVTCTGTVVFSTSGSSATLSGSGINCNSGYIIGTIAGSRVSGGPSTEPLTSTGATTSTSGHTTTVSSSPDCGAPAEGPPSGKFENITFVNTSGESVDLYEFLPIGSSNLVKTNTIPAGMSLTLDEELGTDAVFKYSSDASCSSVFTLNGAATTYKIPHRTISTTTHQTTTVPRTTPSTTTKPSTTTTPSGFGIDWRMPARLSREAMLRWSAFQYGLPPASYVDPRPGSWKVTLFTTNGCPAGYSYRWKVNGHGLSAQLPETGCRVETTVPELGAYDVTATQLRAGAPTGAVAQKRVVVRDWLLVGLGDSNGSGEGNPPWIFAQCHRSLASSQYRLAQYIEDHDERSSVTLLFAACSGARAEHLWQYPYAGFDSKAALLPPQLTQIEQRLGSRRPDAVIMSIGINDLAFSSLVTWCIRKIIPPSSPCESTHVVATTKADGSISYGGGKAADPTLEQATTRRLNLLPRRYATLARHLALLHPRFVFLTQYPDFATNQNGAICDPDFGPFPHFAETTWKWLEETGTALNQAVFSTTDLGWIPVVGIPADFLGHGYCSPSSYFVTVNSAINDWNVAGAFHATAEGQQITLEHSIPAVCAALYGNKACNGEPPAP